MTSGRRAGLAATPTVTECRVPGLRKDDCGICLAWGIGAAGLAVRMVVAASECLLCIHLAPSIAHVIAQSLFYWKPRPYVALV